MITMKSIVKVDIIIADVKLCMGAIAPVLFNSIYHE